MESNVLRSSSEVKYNRKIKDVIYHKKQANSFTKKRKNGKFETEMAFTPKQRQSQRKNQIISNVQMCRY